MHSVGILPSEEMEHSIRASSVICAHIIPSGKHEPQRDGGRRTPDGRRARNFNFAIALNLPMHRNVYYIADKKGI